MFYSMFVNWAVVSGQTCKTLNHETKKIISESFWACKIYNVWGKFNMKGCHKNDD
jgi:hypothetical protein